MIKSPTSKALYVWITLAILMALIVWNVSAQSRYSPKLSDLIPGPKGNLYALPGWSAPGGGDLGKITELDVREAFEKLWKELDPGFANAVCGNTVENGPITYKVKVEQGKKYIVVAGFSEGFWEYVGKRAANIIIEDRVRGSLDVIEAAQIESRRRGLDLIVEATGGKWVPVVSQPYVAEDLNGDGAITITVAGSASAGFGDCIWNVLWVFEDDGSGMVDLDDVMSGALSKQAYVYVDIGNEDY